LPSVVDRLERLIIVPRKGRFAGPNSDLLARTEPPPRKPVLLPFGEFTGIDATLDGEGENSHIQTGICDAKLPLSKQAIESALRQNVFQQQCRSVSAKLGMTVQRLDLLFQRVGQLNNSHCWPGANE
jgi:hypothetical protein